MLLSDSHPQKVLRPDVTHQCVRPLSSQGDDQKDDSICGFLMTIKKLRTGG